MYDFSAYTEFLEHETPETVLVCHHLTIENDDYKSFIRGKFMVCGDNAMLGMFNTSAMPKDRDEEMPTSEPHFVLGRAICPPFPPGLHRVLFGMGCFWGAERKFWTQSGVYVTAVGYAGGSIRNPTYQDVCTGRSGHAEVVLVVFDPQRVRLEDLLKVFWQSHDPTQGMRQGNDIGSQYRSAIFTYHDADHEIALASRKLYGNTLAASAYPPITTQIEDAGPFYYAEPYHQQYLAKNPDGYCGLGGTGIGYPGECQAEIVPIATTYAGQDTGPG